MNKHCTKTEPCAYDVYCNCWCEQCAKTDCFRPGCYCKKSHAERDRVDRLIKEYRSNGT